MPRTAPPPARTRRSGGRTNRNPRGGAVPGYRSGRARGFGPRARRAEVPPLCEPEALGEGLARLAGGDSDQRAAAATHEGRAAGKELLDDEQRFIDMTKAVVWLAQDRPVVD